MLYSPNTLALAQANYRAKKKSAEEHFGLLAQTPELLFDEGVRARTRVIERELCAAYAQLIDLLLARKRDLDITHHAQPVRQRETLDPLDEERDPEPTPGAHAPVEGAPHSVDVEFEPTPLDVAPEEDVAPVEQPQPNISAATRVLCLDVAEMLEDMAQNASRSYLPDIFAHIERWLTAEQLSHFELLDVEVFGEVLHLLVSECRAAQDRAPASDVSVCTARVSGMFSHIKNTPKFELVFIHGMNRAHEPQRAPSWAEESAHWRRRLEERLALPDPRTPTPRKGTRSTASSADSGLTLEAILSNLQGIYPGAVVVLDSAFESARDAADFRSPERVQNLLERLVTEYLPLLERGGNAQARQVFTQTEFAANESDTARSNERARRLRTFSYEGEEIFFGAHLRIGTARDSRDGWRCHFHHDTARGKIVIGHCGAHLDLN